MKRCRTCNRTYTDPNLSYCIDDGTPLTTEVDDEPPYRPPGSYVPPGATSPTQQRRSWPWIVGILGAFVLGALGLIVAAAILVPRYVGSRQPVIVTTNTNTDDTDPPDDVDAPAPTDEAQVLAQLTDIENEWTAANFNADKKKLEGILADDYVGQAAGGGLEGKRDYINTIQRNTITERWEFQDLKVQRSGDRATLTGVITFFARGQQESFDFTDKFVWRKGRWQATGSEVHKRE